MQGAGVLLGSPTTAPLAVAARTPLPPSEAPEATVIAPVPVFEPFTSNVPAETVVVPV